MEASRISAVCATAMCSPRSASADAICSEQPGLAEMSSGAPAASTASALRPPSSLAASGCSRLYTPAEPQQVPASDSSTRFNSGIARSSSRGCRVIRWACAR